ncbi:nitrile hydratase accessory protein [Amycolatopsis pigmentata]|uniref:Nitrile hydratase accessory protein n=1 Tax=Amycolatopsis pigmentata TaxID=450801 RepID=A0ABW5FPG9_9PSEU
MNESGSGERPGFAEPWQAQAFACVHQLSDRGLFTWHEWTEVFGAQIADHPQMAGETVEQAYYRQWLGALETILVRGEVCAEADLTATAERWHRAYLNTPHGEPVELDNAEGVCAPRHDHHGNRQPVAVIPARVRGPVDGQR